MIKMSKDWMNERGHFYHQFIREAISEKSALVSKRKAVRDLYFKEPGGFDATSPWEGASDIHLPVIMEKIETAVPKIMAAIWRAEPFVNVRNPDGVSDEKMAKNVERFTSWSFRNDIPDFYLTWENFERNRLLDGTAFAKIRWERKIRKTVETHTLPAFKKPGTIDENGEEVAEPVQRTVDELFAEVFKFGDPSNTFYDYTRKGNDKFKVKFTENGERFEADVEITDSRRIDEVDVRVKRLVVVHDSPQIENVDFEDILMPTRSTSLQKASWVAQKTWIPVNVARRKVKDKEWMLSKVELDNILGNKRANDPENQGMQQQDKVLGVSPRQGTENVSKDKKQDINKILIWEVYAREYVDGDDYPVDVILFIDDWTRKIVAVEYHDDEFPHGRRPFISDTYIPVDGRVYGIGMAEILYGINLSMDKTINHVNNAMEIKGNPWAIYSAYGLAGNSQILSGIRPGEWIPVGDVNAVKFPDFAQDPERMFHASFETLNGFGDRLTFSPSVGGSSNYRNAPRTARGTLALMDAAEEKLSSLIEQSQATAWKEMVRQVVSLYSAYVGIDKWYTVTGETEARRISPRDLRINWQYEYTGTLTSVNREVQMAKAERRYHALRVDPLYESDPHARQALIEDYLKALSDGEDYKKLLPKLPGEGGYSHPPMTQEQELRALADGHGVDVLPIDDDAQHIKDLEKFMMSGAFETIPQHAVAVIAHHLKAHQAALKNKEQMQLTAGGPAQGQMNQQAPEPGIPQEGAPAQGGDLSQINGGPVG